MFSHFFHYVHNSQLVIILNYAFVECTNHILDNSELVEKFTASIQHLMWEHILLSVYPEVWEPFLCRVEDFCKVAQCTFFVENFVSLAKLVSVVTSLEIGFKDFT